jgi:hypothetical protein
MRKWFYKTNAAIERMSNHQRFLIIMIWIAVWGTLANASHIAHQYTFAWIFFGILAAPLLLRVPYYHRWF